MTVLKIVGADWPVDGADEPMERLEAYELLMSKLHRGVEDEQLDEIYQTYESLIDSEFNGETYDLLYKAAKGVLLEPNHEVRIVDLGISERPVLVASAHCEEENEAPNWGYVFVNSLLMAGLLSDHVEGETELGKNEEDDDLEATTWDPNDDDGEEEELDPHNLEDEDEEVTTPA